MIYVYSIVFISDFKLLIFFVFNDHDLPYIRKKEPNLPWLFFFKFDLIKSLIPHKKSCH